MMAREDMLIDEGVTFGRRRTNTPTTPANAAEVQTALDAAATELDVNAALDLAVIFLAYKTIFFEGRV